MNKKRALRLAREWSQGHVRSLRDGEAAEYHSMFAAMLEESVPNEPLTLEQLRKMDGEPVWIVDVGTHKWYGPGWAIVDRDNCLVRTAYNWNPVFFEKYGERWLAYRRPPERQEGTDA